MDAFLENATTLIESALARFSKRDLVSASEVTDLLLDIRWMVAQSVERDEKVEVS